MLKTHSMPSLTPSFERIALIGNDRDTRVVDSLRTLASHLTLRGREVWVDAASILEFGPQVKRAPEADLAARVNLLVAVGGDGTMLHAARLAAPHGVPVLGVNRGR
jgi:NAD+ kinase